MTYSLLGEIFIIIIYRIFFSTVEIFMITLRGDGLSFPPSVYQKKRNFGLWLSSKIQMAVVGRVEMYGLCMNCICMHP